MRTKLNPMRVHPFLWTIFLACIAASLLPAQQLTCDNSLLQGAYAFTLNSRSVTNGTFGAVGQDVGTATLDGNGNATINVTFNTNAQAGQTQNLQGTYNLKADCTGTLTLPGGTVLNLVAFAQGFSFSVKGNSSGQAATGGGTALPRSCVTAVLSGPFAFSANGYTLSGTKVSGVADLTGLFQFDGFGNVTATWSVTSGATPTTVTASGQYSLGTNCQGTATLNDSTNMVTYVFTYSVIGGINDFSFIASSPALIFSGAGHASDVNPGKAVVNSANGLPNSSSPGSIFTIYGQNLASAQAQAPKGSTLPDTLLTTSVTVNGENAPLFYVNTGQINAQMPVDIPAGNPVVTVIVKNGNAQSNAVAVRIPFVSPGIFAYGNNHAVATFKNGSLNTENKPAHVGDTLIAYFCGGGPVQVEGALATGVAAPNQVAPISSVNYSVTVGGVQATTSYVGLTPTAIGLYQANFHVPQVAAGDQPLVLTINGQQSNAPVITIAN